MTDPMTEPIDDGTPDPWDALNEQQRRFVVEFIKHGNASKAARDAGYSKHSCGQQGAYLRKLPKIAAVIEQELEAIVSTRDHMVKLMLANLRDIAFFDISQVVRVGDDGNVVVLPTSEWPPEAHRSIAEMAQTITKDGGSIKVKQHDKLAAMNLLAKLLEVAGAADQSEDPKPLAIE